MATTAAHLAEPIEIFDSGLARLAAGAQVYVYQPGTTTQVTCYSDSATTLPIPQPLIADITGAISFYLPTSQYVDLAISGIGFTTRTISDVLVPGPAGALGSNVVTAVAGKVNPISQIQQVIASSDLTDSVISASVVLANNQEIVVDHNGKLFNILHRYRPQGYAGYAGDGATDGSGTDNSAVLNSMFSEANAAGRGYVEFPDHIICCKNVVAAYPKLHVDFNGATLVQHSSSLTTDDLLQGWNFATLTGGTAQVTAGTVPFAFDLENLTLMQPSGKGRHCLALYAAGFRMRNVQIYSASIGSALWTEYGTTAETFSTGTPPTLYGDAGFHIQGLRIYDAPSTSSVLTLPSANDMSLSVSAVTNVTNPQITTTRPHYLSAGMAVTISGVGGATGVNGAQTVLAVVDATNFTVTAAAPGVYTSGGTVTYHVSAAWANLGPHDSHCTSAIIISTARCVGRRGIMNGTNGSASNTGCGFEHLHIYDNWDVGMDSSSSNILLSGDTQLEGSYKAVNLIRSGGRFEMAGGSIYGGHAGVTLMDIRVANQNKIRCKMMLCGSGVAPPSGFNNTYLYTSSVSDSEFIIEMQHDYNTNAAATAGTKPSNCNPMAVYMDAYGISTAALTAGWLTSIDATHAGIFQIPTGLTVTNG